MKIVTGLLTPVIIYALITLLHYYLPGRWIDGYVTGSATGRKMRYRLNGKWVLLVCIAFWFVPGYLGWVPYDWLYQTRWYSLAGAAIIGLIYSLWIVAPYPSTGKKLLADFFLGRLKNPQHFNKRADAKMWLYLIGTVMLELNVMGFLAHRYMAYGQISPGILLCGVLLAYFVCDYFVFEKVHLYTYDLIAERVGMKLGFGCLTFYPYFYLVGLWATIDLPHPAIPGWLLIIYALVFFSGWSLARGANIQKYFFKTQPDKSFLGIMPETISDGRHTLLVNGFWGLNPYGRWHSIECGMSRHSPGMALSLVLCAVAEHPSAG